MSISAIFWTGTSLILVGCCATGIGFRLCPNPDPNDPNVHPQDFESGWDLLWEMGIAAIILGVIFLGIAAFKVS